MQIERKTMKIKREDIDNMSHISVIAAIALPENLEEAARSIPDEVIKQGMVMEHCLYYSQVQNQHLDLKILLSRINIAMRAWPRPYPIRSWPHIV
mgnify:CR=1 FL=1